jgi:DNA-binding CsgD family transcriptional regulator
MATEELLRAAPAPMLEREAELAALEAMLTSARHGEGRLAVVEGSAGIGKTRLLGEVRELARAGECGVLTARAGELEGEVAFGVVRQLFEAPLALASPAARAELFSGAAELCESLFASAPGPATPQPPETPFAMLHGLYWLTANFVLRQPTLLVVDDLHWADTPSLRWLEYLARRLDGLPLLLLLGTRPLEQAKTPDLVTALVADPESVVIRPGNLGRESVAALASQRLGAEPDKAFSAALHRSSGGNPLYLAALLDALVREGLAPTADHVPQVLELGPQAIYYGIASRLAHLPANAATLLRAAAIVGDHTQLRVAAMIAELSPTASLDAASALVRAELLRNENPLEFIHPVVRTAVLEDISGAEKARTHRRAAEALVDAGAVTEQAAAHLVQTIPAGDPWVVATLRQAAQRSIARGAPAAAVAYLGRALEEPPTPTERLEVLYELGGAELNTDPLTGSEHLRQAVDALEEPTMRPDIALAYERAVNLLGRQQDANDLLAELSDAARDLDPDLHWRLEGRLIIWSQFDPPFYAKAMERLETIDEEDLTGGTGAGVLLAAWSIVEARRGESRARAVGLARRALTSGAFEEPGERLNIVNPLFALAVAGESDEVARMYAALISSVEKQGDLLSLAAFQLFRGRLRTERGELLAAEEDLRPLEHSVFHDSPGFQAYRAAFLSEILLERGELAEAEALTSQPIAASPGHRLHLLEASGRVRLEAGQPEVALSHLVEAGDIAAATGNENPAFSAWRSLAALALRRLEREHEALELAREELERSQRWGAPRAVGVSLRALGLVEGGPAGEQLLREAVEILGDSPARLEHARALVDLGATLRRNNRRSDARRILRDGVDLALRCGASALADRGNQELAATGAHPRSILLSGLDALTASERRVAQLAAEGLSNKEIAQTLFVTVKTVEQHLGRVYRKLEIGSRKQLGSALGSPPATHPAA